MYGDHVAECCPTYSWDLKHILIFKHICMQEQGFMQDLGGENFVRHCHSVMREYETIHVQVGEGGDN